ncbi:MAG TPA: hypothetical protein VMH30_04760, partial [Verrucomicrobiae bacterium]|nr:hypothetical protein [Verrucomicrobiae bacterium]
MEPERKIEKLLRAYAKKRRADAGEPLKLHPAMRRLLQDEVARQPNPREEKYVSLWELFRQQWAIIAGFALVIFFCASLFLPALSPAKRKAQNITAVSPNPIPSASNSSQAEQRAVAMAPPAPVPAGIPEVAPPAAPANASAGIQESTLAGNLQPSSAPPAAAPAMADRLLATQAFYYRNIAPNSDQTYSRNIARGQTFGTRSPAIAQNAGSSAQIMSVLANFQLQQNGNAIRVVDSDGSIYAGSLFPMQTAAQNTPATINGAAGSVQKDSSRTAGIGPQTTGYFANNT